jgi:hypothetical protein
MQIPQSGTLGTTATTILFLHYGTFSSKELCKITKIQSPFTSWHLHSFANFLANVVLPTPGLPSTTKHVGFACKNANSACKEEFSIYWILNSIIIVSSPQRNSYQHNS